MTEEVLYRLKGKPRGRPVPQTTGRFDTREELVTFVTYRWQHTAASQTDIAIAARVSVSTVRNILKDNSL